MQHSEQLAAAYNEATGTYEYDECFQYIQPILSQGDLTIGNLETTLAGTEKSQYRGWPRFNSPDAFAATLKRAGFDVLITANNHAADHFAHGINRTIDALDSLEITHVGTYKNEEDRKARYPLVYEKDRFRVGILAYTDLLNILPVPAPYIINRSFENQIKADLEEVKGMDVDFTLVYMHWGNEYKIRPSASQRSLAAFCYDHGADFVIGTHPHVVQPIEKRGYLGPVKNNPGLVVYSLGNFISDFSGKHTQGGMLFELMLKKDSLTEEVSLLSYGFIPTWVKREEAKYYSVLPVSEIETGRITANLNDDDIDEIIQYGLDTRLRLEEGSFEVQYQLSNEIVADFEEHIQIQERRITKPSLANDTPIDSELLATSELPKDETNADLVGAPIEMSERPESEIIGYDKKGNAIYKDGKEYLNVKQKNAEPGKLEVLNIHPFRTFDPLPDMELARKKVYYQDRHLYFAGYEADAGVPPPKGYYDTIVRPQMPPKPSKGKVIYAEADKKTPKNLDTLYRVQFMASNQRVMVNTAIYDHLQGYKVLEEDSFFKYVIGESGSIEEIKELCRQVRQEGHSKAFIVLYVLGERIRNIFEL